MPLTCIVPAVGCSRSAITRKNVVLPQPDGPMNETNSPLLISSVTSESALTGPSLVVKVRESPCAETTLAAALVVGAVTGMGSSVVSAIGVLQHVRRRGAAPKAAYDRASAAQGRYPPALPDRATPSLRSRGRCGASHPALRNAAALD